MTYEKGFFKIWRIIAVVYWGAVAVAVAWLGANAIDHRRAILSALLPFLVLGAAVAWRWTFAGFASSEEEQHNG